VVIVDIALRQGNGFDVLKSLAANPLLANNLRRQTACPYRADQLHARLVSHRREADGRRLFFDKSNEIPEMLRVIRGLVVARTRRTVGHPRAQRHGHEPDPASRRRSTKVLDALAAVSMDSAIAANRRTRLFSPRAGAGDVREDR
jgi:hypothetical protein